jgi:hypothetical protein
MGAIIMYIDENGNEAIFNDTFRDTYIFSNSEKAKRRAETCKEKYGWQTYIIMDVEEALDLLFDTCHTCEVEVVKTTIDVIHAMAKLGLAEKA